jgi:dolichyl-phosphate beta-glucosyltransferase
MEDCIALPDVFCVNDTLLQPAARATPGLDHDLTVVIPAYNEENRLPWTLDELGRFLDRSGLDYRVLVADDGSRDYTCLLTLSRGPRFSTLRLPRHRGKGAAVRAGMLRAAGRVVAFTDADLPYQLDALKEGYRWIEEGRCEVVFGARDLDGSVHRAPRRLARTIATAAYRQIVKRVISREVTDTQCGLKLFSRRAARAIFSRAAINGFAFDAEIVLLAQRLGLSFRRLPVTLVNEYSSTLSLSWHSLPMLWDLGRIWLRDRLAGGKCVPRFDSQPAEAAPRGTPGKRAA